MTEEQMQRVHDLLYSCDSREELCERIVTLEDENAKLRELLKVAYRCTNAGPSCLECRMVAGGCTLLSAMRELGVE